MGWRWHSILLRRQVCFWPFVLLATRPARCRGSSGTEKSPRRSVRDYLNLFRTRSYLINCIAMTLMTFVTGGLVSGVPAYLRYRGQSPAVGMTIFGLSL